MKDIRSLSQHFNNPCNKMDPWIFTPEENIKEISTDEHPGLLTIWQNGKGKDIKGILKEPIKISDYAMPWEFELALVQNFAAYQGLGDVNQQNYAIGMNLAVTFSDPSTWPEDRAILPADTYTFQLLVVHIGSTGEFSRGLPQFQGNTIYPENFLVWGRGDLSEEVNGNWEIPFVNVGGYNVNGPASQQAIFICDVVDPVTLKIGIKFESAHDYKMKTIDCSGFGKITGIWELGPVFSCDSWIPDVLCKQLPASEKMQHIVRNTVTGEISFKQLPLSEEMVNPPTPVSPNPIHEFYLDYCVFLYGGNNTENCAPFEHQSDDFNIPGYLGQWRGLQLPFLAETWSNPGYLTITLRGPSQGLWFGSKALCAIDLSYYNPPWEMEICFIAPDDSIPWNLHFHHKLYNQNGEFKGYWQPGVQNNPYEKRHRFVNSPHEKTSFDVHNDYYPDAIKTKCLFNVKFDPDVPEEILANKPLCMLYQMIDSSHVRIGFRKDRESNWYLSQIFDCSEIMGGEILKLGETCWASTTGRHWLLPAGSPVYQKFLIDYVYYRYGLSTV